MKTLIQTALEEDRVYNDITTKALVNPKQISQAYIISREEGVICGNAIVKEIFKKFGGKTTLVTYHQDGDPVKKNEPVIFIKGQTATILSCERVALNFLGHLSGISTLTRHFVDQTKGHKAKILDTRKTTPGLRDLEKYAVVCGGGENHRRDLSDMVLIKDNHLSAKTRELSLKEIVKRARRYGSRSRNGKKVELEVDTLTQFKEALDAKPDMILLDNMSLSQIKTAVSLKKKAHSKILLEVSGGVTLKTVNAIAKTGIDRISVGQLTHSAPSLDFSLEFVI